MSDTFDEDKERAAAVLMGARAQVNALTSYMVSAWTRPYNDLFAFYDRVINEPPPPIQEWPARAVVSSITRATNALESQHSAERLEALAADMVKACDAALSPTPDTLEIDRESEAAGPLTLAPRVPVQSLDDATISALSCPGVGVIPTKNIDLTLQDGKLLFTLVGLKTDGPQPLAQGLYVGSVIRPDGHIIAELKVHVVARVP